MTARKHLFTILSASLFVAVTTFAATPAPVPPTPTPPIAPTPTTPMATPTVLWVIGDPTPQWLVLDYFSDRAACDKAMATISVTPPQEAGCFPVGVDPARLHDQYGSMTSTPEAK